MSNRPKFRTIGIVVAVIATMLVALGAWRWWSVPDWQFPVERLALVNSHPEFSPGGLIAEDCVSVAYEIRQRTWRSVARVIVDERRERGGAAYAFVGGGRGTVYTLQPAGIDSWTIIAETAWSGDPRTHVLQLNHDA